MYITWRSTKILVQFWTEIFRSWQSLFLAPPLRTTSCNVHYSGSMLYDKYERETWSKVRLGSAALVIFTWILILYKLRGRRQFLGKWRLDNMTEMSCIVRLGCGSKVGDGKRESLLIGGLLFPRRCRTRSRWFDQSFSLKSQGGGGGWFCCNFRRRFKKGQRFVI